MSRKKIPLGKIEAAYAFNAFKPNPPRESDRLSGTKGETRVMYIENKSEGLSGGEARIGRVTFSKTGRTIYYRSRAFKPLKGGFKANYFETETGEEFWISGPKKDGKDRLYNERVPVEIDENARVEYWMEIRNLPSMLHRRDTTAKSGPPNKLMKEIAKALKAPESDYVPLDVEKIIRWAKAKKKVRLE
jgi:hypothetical protein